MLDANDVKAAVVFRDYLESDIGPPHRRGQKPMWLCPFHDEKTPSFTLTPDGNAFRCFGCDRRGDILEYIQERESVDFKAAVTFLAQWAGLPDTPPQTEEERRLFEIERRQREMERRQARLERRQAEQERRLTLLEQMHNCTDHLTYHKRLQHNDAALEYWFGEGMTTDTIDRYLLGYCDRCPTDHEGRPSYTIPVIIHGKLYNIRHRLQNVSSDKYRPHMAGLPQVLFNADALYKDTQRIIIVEGEKKSIIATQSGFPENVGIMGKSGFDPRWAAKFGGFPTVYVALDPDAIDTAAEIAALFEGRGRVVTLPGKLDDLIVRYGAGADDIEAFLRGARKV